ncbi:MAG: flippase-like domain-containing protein [Muribaculaceae bacterium]|nr:flippase-like domain-containing protein [Muribaculaceae bacterium]
MKTSETKNTTRHGGLSVGKILKVVVPLAVSVGLVLWLFHKVHFSEVMEIIHRGVDYRFIIAMMLVTLLSHTIRGIRWGIQLRAAGVPRIPPVAECVSIYGAYALNLVFPYLGEAWRCVYISRREGVSLSTVIGTDIGDRGSDGVMILMILIFSLFVARPQLSRFMDKYPIGEGIERLADNGTLWLIVAGVIILCGVLLYIFRDTAAVKSFKKSALQMWSGFAVLFHMKDTGLYIVLTFGIWICYFFETYLCFFAFPFTRELIYNSPYTWGLLPGLVVFVFGSVSMIVPSNGGLGPWNVAVMFALSLFGISDSDGTAYSMVCWSFQTVMLVAEGLFGAAYIMLHRSNAAAMRLKDRSLLIKEGIASPSEKAL